MYLYERAYWEDGLYIYSSELIEGEPCGLENFKLTEEEQAICHLQYSNCRPRGDFISKGQFTSKTNSYLGIYFRRCSTENKNAKEECKSPE